MFFVFIFFWVIALLILLKENRSPTDNWSVIIWFLYGFGGLSVVFRELRDQGIVSWVLPGLAASIAIVWGPFALLTFALHFSGLMPKNKKRRVIVMTALVLPVLLFYILVPALKFFGEQEPIAIRVIQTRILTAIFTPYYFGTFGILLWNLLRKREGDQNSEKLITFIIVVPPSLSYYFIAYLIPSLGDQNPWKASIVAVICAILLFLFFVIKKNAFGLSFYQPKTTKSEMDKRVAEGTDFLRQTIKSELLLVEMALQKTESIEVDNPEELKKVMNDVDAALVLCQHSLDMLDIVRRRIFPKATEFIECRLLPLLDQSIDQSLGLFQEREVIIDRNYSSDPVIQCDPKLLMEAMSGLIINAIEAKKAQGICIINIDVTQDRKNTMIQIRDNGCGVERGLVHMLGIPLLTSKNNGKHLGLGLYYAKKVIDMHGGRFILATYSKEGMAARIVLPGNSL